jgi:hypothetical protein
VSFPVATADIAAETQQRLRDQMRLHEQRRCHDQPGSKV